MCARLSLLLKFYVAECFWFYHASHIRTGTYSPESDDIKDTATRWYLCHHHHHRRHESSRTSLSSASVVFFAFSPSSSSILISSKARERTLTLVHSLYLVCVSCVILSSECQQVADGCVYYWFLHHFFCSTFISTSLLYLRVHHSLCLVCLCFAVSALRTLIIRIILRIGCDCCCEYTRNVSAPKLWVMIIESKYLRHAEHLRQLLLYYQRMCCLDYASCSCSVHIEQKEETNLLERLGNGMNWWTSLWLLLVIIFMIV